MKKAIFLATLMFGSMEVFAAGNSSSEILQESSDPIVAALRSGDVDQIEKLIKDGADINNTIIDGTTPLIFAVKNDNRPLVKTLILSGVNVDTEDSQHETALSAAIDSNDEDMVRLLVKTGKADIYKNGVFDKAMQSSDKIKGCMEHLNIRPLVESVKNNDIDGVKKALKNKKVNINGRDNKGYTPLMYAASRGNLDIINLLLDKGAKVNIVSKEPAEYNLFNKASFGDNALFFAARNGKTEALKMLMEVSGYDIKEAVVKSNKRKDLMKNIYRSALSSTRNTKSFLTLRNGLGQTLLISALKNGREDTAIWLIDQGAGVNDTYYETEYGNEYGEHPVAYKRSPLAIAEQNNLQKAVEKLKEKGAVSVNRRLPDKLKKAAKRESRRKDNEDNYESSLEAAAQMYENEEIRKARREKAEANYDSSLRAASRMIRKGKIAPPQHKKPDRSLNYD